MTSSKSNRFGPPLFLSLYYYLLLETSLTSQSPRLTGLPPTRRPTLSLPLSWILLIIPAWTFLSSSSSGLSSFVTWRSLVASNATYKWVTTHIILLTSHLFWVQTHFFSSPGISHWHLKLTSFKNIAFDILPTACSSLSPPVSGNGTTNYSVEKPQTLEVILDSSPSLCCTSHPSVSAVGSQFKMHSKSRLFSPPPLLLSLPLHCPFSLGSL